MDNCCDSLLKYLIFIFNFVFFLTGAALIAVGAYVQIEMSNYLNFLGDSYLNASVLFIVLGVVILVIGFCGCCGAYTENACMMFSFSALLAVIVIIEIAVAVAVFAFHGQADALIKDKMVEGMMNYSKNSSSEYAGVTETWNLVQHDFRCCGVTAFSDWRNASVSDGGRNLPDSCCVDETADCGVGKAAEDDPSGINQLGCYAKLVGVVNENSEVVIGVGCGIVLLQILGVLVSCMLANNMRRRNNYV